MADIKREFLRHTLATLAYRGGKALRGAPAEFAAFRAVPGGRCPAEILAHIGDLLDWTLRLAQGDRTWRASAPLAWDAEVQRFFASLAALDAYLASEAPLKCETEKLFQAPIADAFTHIGQISMTRRQAGSPVRNEVYLLSEIIAGRVGPDQAAPVREF